MNSIDVKLNYIELDYIRQSLNGQIEYLLRCRLMSNDQIGHDFKELETLHAKIESEQRKCDC
jgi:hypothetical protein